MARGTAAPRVAGRQGSARLANGERRPARGVCSARGHACGDGALGAWTSVQGLGNRQSQRCLGVRAQGVPRRVRVVWRADVARESSGAPRVKTNPACLLGPGFFSKNLNCSAQKFD
jgi:hypothetical protein